MTDNKTVFNISFSQFQIQNRNNEKEHQICIKIGEDKQRQKINFNLNVQEQLFQTSVDLKKYDSMKIYLKEKHTLTPDKILGFQYVSLKALMKSVAQKQSPEVPLNLKNDDGKLTAQCVMSFREQAWWEQFKQKYQEEYEKSKRKHQKLAEKNNKKMEKNIQKYCKKIKKLADKYKEKCRKDNKYGLIGIVLFIVAIQILVILIKNPILLFAAIGICIFLKQKGYKLKK